MLSDCVTAFHSLAVQPFTQKKYPFLKWLATFDKKTVQEFALIEIGGLL